MTPDPNQQSLPSAAQPVAETHAAEQRKLLRLRIFSTLSGLAFVLYGAPGTWNIWRLTDEGREAVAKVTAVQYRSCGKSGRSTCETHKLAADGREFEVKLETTHAVGTEIRITYLPRDPGVVVPGPRSNSRWHNLYQIGTGNGAGGFDLVAFFCGLLFVAIGLVQTFLLLIEIRKNGSEP